MALYGNTEKKQTIYIKVSSRDCNYNAEVVDVV